jgi:hypothetical protein
LFDTRVNNAPKETASAGLEVNSGGFAGSLTAHYRGDRLDWGLDSYGYTTGTAPNQVVHVVNTYSQYGLPSLTTLDASLAYKWSLTSGDSFKTVETRLTFTNIGNQQKPIYASSSSLTGYVLTNPLLYLSEPFSVYATVTVAF